MLLMATLLLEPWPKMQKVYRHHWLSWTGDSSVQSILPSRSCYFQDSEQPVLSRSVTRAWRRSAVVSVRGLCVRTSL
jgi:hypothetical protein